MSKPIAVACPKCGGGPVDINVSAGGRGTGDLTSYSADCAKCGLLIDHLSDTGRYDSAVRDYNRWAREYAPPVGATSVTVRAGYDGYGLSAATLATPVRPAPVVVAAPQRLRTISTRQLRVSMVIAEVGAAIHELAAHEGAIFRLGLSLKHQAGIFEMTGVAQQQGLGEVLQAVKNAREEARLNPLPNRD